VSTAIVAKRPVLVDRLGATSVLTNVLYVLAGTALIAGAAQIQIPMWPVPITGQTFAVLLVGASLGMVRGLLSTSLYLGLAVAGLPVLAPTPDGGHITGLAVFTMASAGYVYGFILASIVLGWFAERQWDRKVLTAIVSFVIAELVIYAVGLPWLSVWLGQHGFPNTLSATLEAGLNKYIIGDVIKAVAAGAILPLSWKLVNRKDS
jgi:biotin transport system substrate-specific component